MEELLRLFAFDDTDALWWRGKDGTTSGPLEFYVPCNDVFHWGSSDLERIALPDDLVSLAQAKACAPDDWPLLWCARKRQMRPQGAVYPNLSETVWSLFDACGPVREVGFGNPKAQPTPVDKN